MSAARNDHARLFVELDAIRQDVAEAADIILFATETALAKLSDSGPHGACTARDVQTRLHTILAACAFEDTVGQRLTRLKTLLSAEDVALGDPLLHGPANSGDGLDQAAADTLFQSIDPIRETSPCPLPPVA